MESNVVSDPQISLRYFPLKNNYVYAQLSSKMSQDGLQKLTGQTPNQK